MNPSEAWSLLTIRSSNFARVSKGHGSVTSSDIAALLGGLEREPFLMGMAAELGDADALEQVERRLWVRANKISDDEGWDPPRGQFTVRRLVGLALFEVIDDRRCYVCNGTGSMAFELRENPALMLCATFEAISTTSGHIRCPGCQGSKVVKLSGRRKADLAGINKDTWTRTWSRRYQPIYNLAHNWREEARQHLAARIRAEAEDAVTAKVDKPAQTAASEVEEARAKNTKQIKQVCKVEKNLAKSSPRVTAPDENVVPVEIDFSAFRWLTLRPLRPRRKLA